MYLYGFAIPIPNQSGWSTKSSGHGVLVNSDFSRTGIWKLTLTFLSLSLPYLDNQGSLNLTPWSCHFCPSLLLTPYTGPPTPCLDLEIASQLVCFSSSNNHTLSEFKSQLWLYQLCAIRWLTSLCLTFVISKIRKIIAPILQLFWRCTGLRRAPSNSKHSIKISCFYHHCLPSLK